MNRKPQELTAQNFYEHKTQKNISLRAQDVCLITITITIDDDHQQGHCCPLIQLAVKTIKTMDLHFRAVLFAVSTWDFFVTQTHFLLPQCCWSRFEGLLLPDWMKGGAWGSCSQHPHNKQFPSRIPVSYIGTGVVMLQQRSWMVARCGVTCLSERSPEKPERPL